MVFYSQEMSSWLLVAGCAVNAEPFLFFVVRPDLNSSSKSLPLWGRCPEGRRGNAAVEGFSSQRLSAAAGRSFTRFLVPGFPP